MILLLAAACGGGGGSGGGGGGNTVVAGDPLLESITTSDAVVGGKGRILVTLRNTVGKDADVTLTSSSSGAATIPGTLKVVAGSKIGEVEYTGTSPGTFLVSAAVNGTQFTATGNVVTAVKVSSVGGSTRLQKGAGAVLTVSMNMVLPKDTEVSLASSNPAAIAVPATITVPAFRSFAQVAIAGAAVGATTITATLAGQSVAQAFFVTDTVTVNFVSLSPSRAVKGAVGSMTVFLNATVAKDAAVTLESSKSDVVAVPSTITIPAGNSSLSVPFTASAAGTAIIKATFGGSARITTEVVVEKNGVRQLNCTNRLSLGATTECSIFLDATAMADTPVALTSSTAGVLDLPTALVIPAGLDSLSFSVSALKEGSTVVTATVDGSSKTTTVVVPAAVTGGAGQLSYFYGSPSNGAVGGTGYIYGGLDTAVTQDTAVTLTSSNTAVVAVPATLTIPTGGSSFQIPFAFAGSGFTLITAEINGVKNYAPMFASNATSIYFYNYTPTPAEPGVVSYLYVGISGGTAPMDLPVTVSLGTAGIIDVPTSGTLKANQSSLQLPVRTLAAGSTTIKVTVAGQVFASAVAVVASAKVSSVSLGTFSTSAPGTLSVSLDATVAKDTTVTLTQSGAGAIAGLPATMVIRTGTNSNTVSLLGQTAGAVTVTATLGSDMKTGTTTVGP
ncbi:MAG: hypothetical protein K1X89_23695 [Myxococcaceae bacterium]|nr:hypothetical protein [Myxococcaceae bacterium]